ncbi:ABC transporter permease [Arachnia propionica]|uniref:Transport permease protein n=1 Tax=Arachnia propionica TaxID=1750 RepID=A0A3P1TB23_9ACTN|nr:ABC transporter permease [Arachnia propionica]MDO5082092.1 ABC transporter permease [Arachnia propionica]RRD06641.1 ABC transporter permease [Arachnia propionica]
MTPLKRPRIVAWLADVAALTGRNVIALRRSPEVMAFSVLQPILFVLLFTQVFGGAINVQGSDYTNYLLAGIFGQTMVFASLVCGISIAEDLKKGIIDRFRSLPMHPSAILMACTLSNLIVSAFSILVMAVTGLLVGWRFSEGIGNMLVGFVLLLGFSWAMSWLMIALGAFLGDARTVNTAGMLVVMPMSFLSNVFVPLESLSGWMRVVAEWNPVSVLVQACRTLFGNLGSAPAPEVWLLQNSVAATLGYLVVFVVVFAPLAVLAFRARTRA